MNEMSDKLETAISELKSANLQLHKDIAKKEEVDENVWKWLEDVVETMIEFELMEETE